MTAFFLRLPNVIERTGLSRSALYRAVSSGTFPPQVRLGVRAVGWALRDIERWEAERIAASNRTTSSKRVDEVGAGEGPK